jgi:hypothetical protein
MWKEYEIDEKPKKNLAAAAMSIDPKKVPDITVRRSTTSVPFMLYHQRSLVKHHATNKNWYNPKTQGTDKSYCSPGIVVNTNSFFVLPFLWQCNCFLFILYRQLCSAKCQFSIVVIDLYIDIIEHVSICFSSGNGFRDQEHYLQFFSFSRMVIYDPVNYIWLAKVCSNMRIHFFLFSRIVIYAQMWST